MAVQTIRGGGSIDTLTPAELQQFYNEQRAIEDARQRELQKTKKDLRRSTLLSTPAQTRVTVLDGISPLPGYKWVVRFISVFLAAAGTGQAFITSDSSTTLGQMTQAKCVAAYTTSAQYQVATLPEGACILSEAEGLYLNFTQNVNGYMLAGWEIMAERIGELA